MTKPTPWSTEHQRLADRVLALTPFDLPPTPWRLRQGITVHDNGKFLHWLQQDAKLGPRSPRARNGVLQEDMKRTLCVVLRHRMERILRAKAL